MDRQMRLVWEDVTEKEVEESLEVLSAINICPRR
jgi:hypothetical protein